MEADGRLDVGEGLLVRVALADDRALDSKRICDVTVGVLFDDDLHLTHEHLHPRVQAAAAIATRF